MTRTPGFVASLLLPLCALGCAGGATASANTATTKDAATKSSSAKGDKPLPPSSSKPGESDQAQEPESAKEPPEPTFAKSAREMLHSAQPPENPLQVAFVAGQSGADLPWTIIIANNGSTNVDLAADVRLIELEVKKPEPEAPPEGTKPKAKPAKEEKPVICQFSTSERPKQVDKDVKLELAPSTMAVYRFDPRLLCDEGVLVPGAVVTPRFGWPLKTKSVWTKGKKEEVVLPQEAPFVAEPPSGAKDAPEPLKQLVGEPFKLDESYAPPPPTSEAKDSKEPPPLEISVRPLGSTTDTRDETVTVDIKNPASVSRYLFVRRELITYEVSGPGGTTTCVSYPDERAPVRQSFEHLSPGKTITLPSRLSEMCPPGTFDTGGLYRVHARLEARDAGDEYKLDAFVGTVTSKKPGILRVKGGEPPHMVVLSVAPPKGR